MGLGAAASGSGAGLTGLSGAASGAAGAMTGNAKPNFMGNYGDAIMGAAGTLMPLLMKKPDPNAKPYKKGTNLVKYQEATKKIKSKETTSAKADSFSDPQLNQAIKYLQGGYSPSENLAPVETLVGKNVGTITPTQEQTNAKLLEKSGETYTAPSDYNVAATARMGGLAGLLKAMHRYKGRGSGIINPIGRFGSWSLPFGILGVNVNEATSTKDGESSFDFGKFIKQSAGDLAATIAGRKASRAAIRPIQEKLAQNKKLKEDVKQFKEKQNKYSEDLITWKKELEDAKSADKNMSAAQRKQRLDDFNEGKVKHLHSEQEVLSRRPKKPSAKNIDLPKGIMQLYRESLKQEAQKIGDQFGLGFLKNLSVKNEEALVRGTRQKVKSLSEAEKRIQRNERNSNIGLGLIAGTAVAGTGSLPFLYYADKKAELKKELEEKQKRKQKSNKKN
jgi:hypothetical protein